MASQGNYPPEALLLALAAQIGNSARELLLRSGFGALLQQNGQTLSRMLAEALRPGGAPEGAWAETAISPDERDRPSERRAAVAGALVRFWSQQAPPRTLQRYGEAIDAGRPAGRWELLALTILMGAPVRRASVEETFCELRREGLLDLRAAAAARPDWCEAVDRVMARSYRGPVRKDLQRQRLAGAARALLERWHGDLNNLYAEAGRSPEQAVRQLRRSFVGIDRLASWLVRELGRLGAWPGAHRHPAAFYADEHLRQAAARLRLAAPPFRGGELEALVQRHFGGDSSILSGHGRELCATQNVGVCLSRCPVARHCNGWGGLAFKRDTGEEAGGSSTGS